MKVMAVYNAGVLLKDGDVQEIGFAVVEPKEIVEAAFNTVKEMGLKPVDIEWLERDYSEQDTYIQEV